MSTRAFEVSIGFAVYNGEKYIHAALDSLLAQTFTNFELIISDNGSTDATETICRKYASIDNRIRYVRHALNMGAPANFQFVLKEATSEYFMWAAADDVWDKNWIQSLYPVARANHCLAYGQVQTINEQGDPLQHPANNREFNFTGCSFFRRLKYFAQPSLLGKANPIYGIFPKEVLTADVFKILTLSRSGSDTLMLYRLLKDIQFIGGFPVFLYKRIHPGCAGHAIGRDPLEEFAIIRMTKVILSFIYLQYKSMSEYGSLSSRMERVTHLLIAPYYFAINLAYFVITNRRFYNQLH